MQHNERLAKVFSLALYARRMAGTVVVAMSNGFCLGHGSID